MAYDDDNVFAKIIRGELSCEKIYEDQYNLAFNDINPKTSIHIILVPKGSYTSFEDFSANASGEEITKLFQAVGFIARDLGLADAGYRLIVNQGTNGGQEVLHFHVHILGGCVVGPMVSL
jgi:histidine triad (HIT) family protein